MHEDKTGKSKQGENKGHGVSCCHHTSRENGEWGGCRGKERERPVVHHVAPGLVVFTLISCRSLLSFLLFWLAVAVFSVFFWAIHKKKNKKK